MKRKLPLLIGIAVVVLALALYAVLRPASAVILTGVVTTDEVIVSSEIQGRLQRLLVNQGESVTNGQLLGVIQPQEWRADLAFYASSAAQSTAQVARADADLRFTEAQATNQIRQAEANLAATEAQVVQARADLENAKLNFQRITDLYQKKVEPIQTYDQARTTYESAQARVESFEKQVAAAQAGVGLAKASVDQVAASRAGVQINLKQAAAAAAQQDRADVRLGYTEIRAPTNGIIDLRAALAGEVLNPGQAIVTLINPDDLWVRADIEETYIDRIRLGDQLNVRLPSGATRIGTVFYRAVDADYATQRDVSRSKRDIKTFEIRLRCDNADRALAAGMTAYVTLPLGKPYVRR